MENQPDRDYGGWVAEFYKSVARTGQPRYDHVTAAIQVAPGKFEVFLTSRYERLLLPWKTSSEEILVSMLSKRLSDDAAAKFNSPDVEKPLRRILAKSS